MSFRPKLNGTLSQFLTRKKALLCKNLGKINKWRSSNLGIGIGGLIIPHLTTDMLQNVTEVLRLGFNFETVEATEN